MSGESSRRKRYERRPLPAGVPVTARDQQIIEAVYDYRVLNSKQVYRLFFAGLNSRVAERRLERLFDGGYLERRRAIIGGAVSSLNVPTLYLLGAKGSEYLIKQCGYDEVRWKPEHNAIG